MGNPLNTPENRRAISELRETLRKPTHGYDAWMRMILGQAAYSELADLCQPRPGHFVADRITHFRKHD